jgi:hypothetical protein
MILADDDVGEDGLEGEAYDPYEDPVLMADPVAAGLVSPPGDTLVVARPRARRGVGGGWVALLLLGAAGAAAFGAVSALTDGSAWGAILNVAAALLCLVGALVERGMRGLPVGTAAMRIGHYARLAIVVAVLVAVVRYGAEDEGGLDAIAWHVPTAIFAAAVFVQWWRDPQRMS